MTKSKRPTSDDDEEVAFHVRLSHDDDEEVAVHVRHTRDDAGSEAVTIPAHDEEATTSPAREDAPIVARDLNDDIETADTVLAIYDDSEMATTNPRGGELEEVITVPAQRDSAKSVIDRFVSRLDIAHYRAQSSRGDSRSASRSA